MSDSSSQTANTNDCTDAIHKLRAITRRVESFFQLQMQKLQDSVEVLSQLSLENEAVMRLAAEVDRQRHDFEELKEIETERLIEAGEKLSAAWQELEDVQRQRPQARETFSNKSRSPTAKPAAVPRKSIDKTKSEISSLPENTETTLFEMKLLQQQVAEHARRHK